MLVCMGQARRRHDEDGNNGGYSRAFDGDRTKIAWIGGAELKQRSARIGSEALLEGWAGLTERRQCKNNTKELGSAPGASWQWSERVIISSDPQRFCQINSRQGLGTHAARALALRKDVKVECMYLNFSTAESRVGCFSTAMTNKKKI
jgi:hypothetical protein